jgi:hypothetical protein
LDELLDPPLPELLELPPELVPELTFELVLPALAPALLLPLPLSPELQAAMPVASTPMAMRVPMCLRIFDSSRADQMWCGHITPQYDSGVRVFMSG